MGNSQSDIKSRLSTRGLPKHLRPLPAKKLEKLKKLDQRYSRQQPSSTENKQVKFRDFMGEMKEDEDELELIGSGPRGAFRWLKGRRFLNHTSQSILPNDQIELDRARVQAFILRWVFGG